jgi:flap endonuclease-1
VKRSERREEAQKGLAEAQEKGDVENMERYQKRLVKVTPKHNEECQRLLTLMGVPYINVSAGQL